ncbi:MAG: type II secretion system protein GspM [Pseudomonadota bacterium]
MTEFWTQLSDRERQLIIAGAGVALFFVVVQFVVMPLLDWRKDRLAAAESAESTYDLVVEAASRKPVAQSSTASNPNASKPIRNVLSETATQSGVNLIYVNVRPDGAVDANATNVDPATLFAWFSSMEAGFDVRLLRADISREQSSPGTLRAQMTFTR